MSIKKLLFSTTLITCYTLIFSSSWTGLQESVYNSDSRNLLSSVRFPTVALIEIIWIFVLQVPFKYLSLARKDSRFAPRVSSPSIWTSSTTTRPTSSRRFSTTRELKRACAFSIVQTNKEFLCIRFTGGNLKRLMYRYCNYRVRFTLVPF